MFCIESRACLLTVVHTIENNVILCSFILHMRKRNWVYIPSDTKFNFRQFDSDSFYMEAKGYLISIPLESHVRRICD